MMEQIIVTICTDTGTNGTTPCVVRKLGDEFEARMGVAFFGSTQMSKDDFTRCEHNPFHKEFFDNYASGRGATTQAAIEAMEMDFREMSSTLWK